MHSIRIHQLIGLIISFFYIIGVWHRGDIPTVKEIRLKLFYCIFYLIFLVSLIAGAIRNEKVEKTIFLVEISIAAAVVLIKLSVFIWKQNRIYDLAGRVCVFYIQDDDDYAAFNSKLNKFAKFVIVYVAGTFFGGFLPILVVTFIGGEKCLFIEIEFPLDWRNNENAYWIAAIFLSVALFISQICLLSSIIILYLLFVCSLRFEVLGSDLRNLGRIRENPTAKMDERQSNFLEDLNTSIDTHLHLTGLTNDLGTFYADLFFIQFGTSGLCICGSVYCLAFDVGDSTLERFIYFVIFLYFIFEIFMITYFGNDIMLSYNRLSYSMFESDWIEQPQSTKKSIIVFGEYLKKPLTLMVGKIYPLTLETFNRIVHSAYSMFNILKSFHH